MSPGGGGGGGVGPTQGGRDNIADGGADTNGGLSGICMLGSLARPGVVMSSTSEVEEVE